MTKSLIKTLFILAIILLSSLLVIGIVQSFQISSMRHQEEVAIQRAEDMQNKLNGVEEEIAYKESQDYYRDYYELEEKYGKDGDVIYETK